MTDGVSSATAETGVSSLGKLQEFAVGWITGGKRGKDREGEVETGTASRKVLSDELHRLIVEMEKIKNSAGRGPEEPSRRVRKDFTTLRAEELVLQTLAADSPVAALVRNLSRSPRELPNAGWSADDEYRLELFRLVDRDFRTQTEAAEKASARELQSRLQELVPKVLYSSRAFLVFMILCGVIVSAAVTGIVRFSSLSLNISSMIENKRAALEQDIQKQQAAADATGIEIGRINQEAKRNTDQLRTQFQDVQSEIAAFRTEAKNDMQSALKEATLDAKNIIAAAATQRATALVSEDPPAFDQKMARLVSSVEVTSAQVTGLNERQKHLADQLSALDDQRRILNQALNSMLPVNSPLIEKLARFISPLVTFVYIGSALILLNLVLIAWPLIRRQVSGKARKT